MALGGFAPSGPVVILAVIIGLVWICLPFAVFGIKPPLNRQAALLQEQTDVLEEILAEVKKAADPPRALSASSAPASVARPRR